MVDRPDPPSALTQAAIPAPTGLGRKIAAVVLAALAIAAVVLAALAVVGVVAFFGLAFVAWAVIKVMSSGPL
jgi:hypothetical protein